MVLDALVTAAVCVLAAPLVVLPWRAALWWARRYGDLGYYGYRLGRRVGLINLSRAFGGTLSRRDAARLLRRAFQSVAQAIGEGLWCLRPGGADAFVRSGRVQVERPEIADVAVADPRPKILVTAHLGAWDLAILWATRVEGRRGAVVQRRFDNRLLQQLVERARDRLGDTIDKAGAATEALARLRAGQSVAMIVDESAGPRGGWVEWFGRPASTHRLPAALALATGCPVVATVMVRRPGGRYLCRAAWFDPARDPSLAGEDALTTAVGAQLERWVREDVDQWRWMHWRWKHRPDGSEERYDDVPSFVR